MRFTLHIFKKIFVRLDFPPQVYCYLAAGVSLSLATGALVSFLGGKVETEIGLHGSKVLVQQPEDGSERQGGTRTPPTAEIVKVGNSELVKVSQEKIVKIPEEEIVRIPQEEIVKVLTEAVQILKEEIAKIPKMPKNDQTAMVPLPRARPRTPGFYYEMVRVQGDGVEGEYEIIARPCIPNVDMPILCFLPERDRAQFLFRRE